MVKVSSNINQNQNFIPPKRSERVNATLPVRTKEGWEQGEKLSQARHKNNSQNVYHVSNHVVAKKIAIQAASIIAVIGKVIGIVA